MTQAMEYATEEERKIATKLVKRFIDLGWSISVDDGEEITVRRSISPKTVLQALATTDSDTLIVTDQYGRKIGSVWLVWGNGSDLISDWTIGSAAFEAACKHVSGVTD